MNWDSQQEAEQEALEAAEQQFAQEMMEQQGAPQMDLPPDEAQPRRKK